MFIRKLSRSERIIIEKLIVFVEEKHNRCEGHDYSHVLEVTRNAIHIASKIKDEVEPFILICGALLHDIGRINAPDSLMHGIDGGARAVEFMRSLIDDEAIIEKIARVVVRHSPTSMIPPESVEEKVVFDADTVDQLGYMGMVRGLLGQTGTIEHIVENRIAKRLHSYEKLNYPISRKLAKKHHKETLIMVRELRKSLKERRNDIKDVENFKLILET